jgi:CheY-like chemotaxis protein/HPt (histidine-containing phosphotransfer) domain-containing protein
VNSINGAFALAYPTPKLIANAIHAVSAGAESDAGTGADLSSVLKRERSALKILVAEDNATNQKIIKQVLESAGYEVVLASDGEMALDLYESENPDLAILDFNMPQRTGGEVIQAIRAMEGPGERMPAVILSASVTLEARERAAKAGADEFLGKPFDASALIQKIDQLGSRRAATKATSKARGQGNRPTLAVSNERLLSESRLPKGAGRQLLAVDSSEQLIDQARLAQLEDIARDPSFLTELVQGFISDVEAILEKVSRAVADGDTAAIPDLMHSLKGAAVGVGASKLAARAVELENSAINKPMHGSKIMLTEVQACFRATSAHLRQYLQSQHQV